MVGEDRVIMSVKELRRLPVIQQALEKKLTQKQAGERGPRKFGQCGKW